MAFVVSILFCALALAGCVYLAAATVLVGRYSQRVAGFPKRSHSSSAHARESGHPEPRAKCSQFESHARHCEERSDEAIQFLPQRWIGLLRRLRRLAMTGQNSSCVNAGRGTLGPRLRGDERETDLISTSTD